MKRTLSLFVLPLYVALMAVPAFAGNGAHNPRAGEDNDHTHDETDTHTHQNGQGHEGHGNGYGNGHHKTDDTDSDSDRDSDHDSDGNGHGVPELDKSVAGSAAVLLGGGVFVILGRRRKPL